MSLAEIFGLVLLLCGCAIMAAGLIGTDFGFGIMAGGGLATIILSRVMSRYEAQQQGGADDAG